MRRAWIFFVLLVGVSSLAVAGGELSENDIAMMLEKGLSPDIVATMIEKKCVDFEVTPEKLVELNERFGKEIVAAIVACQEGDGKDEPRYERPKTPFCETLWSVMETGRSSMSKLEGSELKHHGYGMPVHRATIWAPGARKCLVLNHAGWRCVLETKKRRAYERYSSVRQEITECLGPEWEAQDRPGYENMMLETMWTRREKDSGEKDDSTDTEQSPIVFLEVMKTRSLARGLSVYWSTSLVVQIWFP